MAEVQRELVVRARVRVMPRGISGIARGFASTVCAWGTAILRNGRCVLVVAAAAAAPVLKLLTLHTGVCGCSGPLELLDSGLWRQREALLCHKRG